MRPVRLELEGFASFRVQTVVDFTDADYFALIGPTGSGKSTILDALTFALYGTAPRWGRSNGIAYALAPTTNLCTVSLVFDVENQRYQVARQVRRSGQAIQQKSVSLVRFLDPTSTETDPDGPDPEVLAGEIKEVNAAIVELLGLTFDDFCQCVVLPQGEFARFLTAGVRERQQILLKLLGASQYEILQKRAGARASQAGTEIDVLTKQLASVEDVTPTAEAAARAHLSSLETLQQRARDLASGIRSAERRATDTASTGAGLASQIRVLSSLRIPDDLPDLHAAVTGATAVERSGREDVDAAATVQQLAETAAEDGPQRAPLELARDRHGERETLARRREEVVDRARAATDAATDLSQQLTVAASTAAQERTAAESAKDAVRSAGTRYDLLQQDVRRLAAVVGPDDLVSLLADADRRDDEYERATSAAVAARSWRTQAVDALGRTVEPAVIDRVRDELLQYGTAIADGAAAARALQLGDEAVLAAETAAATADEELERAVAAYDNAVVRAGAALLRPQLRVGDDCPVCTQTVSVLPPPLDEDDTSRAQGHRRAAEQAARASRQEVEEARGQRLGAQHRLEDADARRARTDTTLATLLPKRPSGEARDPSGDRDIVERLLQERSDLSAALGTADRRLVDADQHVVNSRARRERVQVDLSAARGTLQSLVGSLSDLDAPHVDATDLAAAWNALVSWAEQRSAGTAAALEDAATELEKARGDETATVTLLTEAEQSQAVVQGQHTAAVGAAARAGAEKAGLLDRLSQLESALADAPSAPEVGALLAECDRLRREVEDARRAADSARRHHSAAVEELRRITGQASEARQVLQQARDSVAEMRPVAVDLDDLLVGWTALYTWAIEAIETRRASAAASEAETEAAIAESTSLAAELQEALISHRVETVAAPGGSLGAAARTELAERAERDVAVAVQRARGEATALERERARAADLQVRITDASTRQQVAGQLASLLRSNKFPQWLADSALDTLVAAASESLRRLSGDQFDLTHQKGEFFVIDHADADSERSVRTLSGGETFQASLALALALSEHLAGMGGSTKLESIFLDEGFGTLDPDSLEMVAGTLENLAQGERMVGVITHVAALAERAPIRFRVRRDTRSSVVEREGA